MILKAGLYIVSTPIGNLSDITYRAVETLKNSDLILCEDTRVSLKLLARYNIETKLTVYNDKSDEKTRNYIKNLIEQGQVISLISDAGTPLISDPGYKLVRELKASNIHVDISPGPCAVISALTLSGLPSDRFLFAGFIPKTGSTNFLKEFLHFEATLIFFQSAKRIIHTLDLAKEIFGDRKACIAREITKLHQDIKYDSLSNLKAIYEKKPAKGEIVFLIEGYNRTIIDQSKWLTELKYLMKSGNSAKIATEIVYEKYHLPRKDVYRMANELKHK